MASVTVKLLRKVSGSTISVDFEAEEGPALGKTLRRTLGVKPGHLFSVDVWGHVQEKQGPIEDDSIIFVRKGREFYEK